MLVAKYIFLSITSLISDIGHCLCLHIYILIYFDLFISKTEKRQREIERQIRKWKRRLDTSITAKETNLSKSKIKEWQQLQRDLLENTDLRRKYNRESINVAR